MNNPMIQPGSPYYISADTNAMLGMDTGNGYSTAQNFDYVAPQVTAEQAAAGVIAAKGAETAVNQVYSVNAPAYENASSTALHNPQFTQNLTAPLEYTMGENALSQTYTNIETPHVNELQSQRVSEFSAPQTTAPELHGQQVNIHLQVPVGFSLEGFREKLIADAKEANIRSIPSSVVLQELLSYQQARQALTNAGIDVSAVLRGLQAETRRAVEEQRNDNMELVADQGPAGHHVSSYAARIERQSNREPHFDFNLAEIMNTLTVKSAINQNAVSSGKLLEEILAQSGERIFGFSDANVTLREMDITLKRVFPERHQLDLDKKNAKTIEELNSPQVQYVMKSVENAVSHGVEQGVSKGIQAGLGAQQKRQHSSRNDQVSQEGHTSRVSSRADYTDSNFRQDNVQYTYTGR